jgi:hypothetical protein
MRWVKSCMAAMSSDRYSFQVATPTPRSCGELESVPPRWWSCYVHPRYRLFDARSLMTDDRDGGQRSNASKFVLQSMKHILHTR